MVKGSKFGAIAEFRKEQLPNVDSLFDDEEPEAVTAKAPEPEAIVAPVPDVVEPETKRRGRPPGKRSNPDWKLFSHFLRKKTQRRATLILASREDGVDLSDVLDELLEGWVERNGGS